jgi:type II secretory pathway pseudopilin PulG
MVFALVILGIGILGMASVMVGTSQRQSRVGSLMDLTAAGEAKLEQLRDIAAAGTADTLLLSVGGSLTTTEALHADSFTTRDGVKVVRRWQVVDGPAGTRSVTLRVDPQRDTNHIANTLDLSTLILMGP